MYLVSMPLDLQRYHMRENGMDRFQKVLDCYPDLSILSTFVLVS